MLGFTVNLAVAMVASKSITNRTTSKYRLRTLVMFSTVVLFASFTVYVNNHLFSLVQEWELREITTHRISVLIIIHSAHDIVPFEPLRRKG